MSKNILVIQGHPDNTMRHLCHGVAQSYAEGAQGAGHQVKCIDVAALDFPLIRSMHEFEHSEPPMDIRLAQQQIQWANHLVIIYPLWLGTMPALLKGFFEQVFRYGFALDTEQNKMPKKLLTGKSARIIITMGMPAVIYRYFFAAHSFKSLKRTVLKLSGIKPVRSTIIGGVDSGGKAKSASLAKIRILGEKAK